MTAKSICSGVLRGLAIAGLIFAIGCGRKEREAKDLANEGNQKLAAADATIKEMNLKYQINLLPAFPNMVDESLQTFDWTRFTPEQLEDIRTKLNAHKANIGRIKEIASHKDIRSGVDRAALEMSASYAQKYLDALESSSAVRIGVAGKSGVPVGSPEDNLRIVEARELETKITASSTILENSYNIKLSPLAEGETADRDWAAVKEEDLSEIKKRLQDYQENTARLVGLTEEGVVVTGLDEKKASREVAAKFLRSINDYEDAKPSSAERVTNTME